jgi:hypothetical protein
MVVKNGHFFLLNDLTGKEVLYHQCPVVISNFYSLCYIIPEKLKGTKILRPVSIVGQSYPKVEVNIEVRNVSALSLVKLPAVHHKHNISNNMVHCLKVDIVL